MWHKGTLEFPEWGIGDSQKLQLGGQLLISSTFLVEFWSFQWKQRRRTLVFRFVLPDKWDSFNSCPPWPCSKPNGGRSLSSRRYPSTHLFSEDWLVMRLLASSGPRATISSAESFSFTSDILCHELSVSVPLDPCLCRKSWWNNTISQILCAMGLRKLWLPCHHRDDSSPKHFHLHLCNVGEQWPLQVSPRLHFMALWGCPRLYKVLRGSRRLLSRNIWYTCEKLYPPIGYEIHLHKLWGCLLFHWSTALNASFFVFS